MITIALTKKVLNFRRYFAFLIWCNNSSVYCCIYVLTNKTLSVSGNIFYPHFHTLYQFLVRFVYINFEFVEGLAEHLVLIKYMAKSNILTPQ